MVVNNEILKKVHEIIGISIILRVPGTLGYNLKVDANRILIIITINVYVLCYIWLKYGFENDCNVYRYVLKDINACFILKNIY